MSVILAGGFVLGLGIAARIVAWHWTKKEK